jgi:hypothetical protein
MNTRPVRMLFLLAVVVCVGEPQRGGRPARHVHAVDLVYVAIPVLLTAAAADTLLLVLLRRRREQG